MNCCDFNGLPYVPRREISSAFLRVEVTTLPFPERFDQCRFCSVRTKCVQHFLNNSDEELHTKAQWLRFFVIFYYTLPSSCSPPPRHPLFSPFFSSCAISFYLSLFIISFPYLFPPLKLYYNYPVIHLFFHSSSYYLISPCAQESFFSSVIIFSYSCSSFLHFLLSHPFSSYKIFLVSSSWNIYCLFHLHPSPSALSNL